MVTKELVIRSVQAAINNAVRQIIELDAEGWEGTITVWGRRFDVSITERKEYQ